MCWQIGKLIEEDLLANNRAEYGDRLFNSLEQDIGIKEKTLYKMHNFYQAYKTLPKDDNNLNWSHYRTLAEIKDAKQREYLANLAIENSWSTRQLEQEAKKLKEDPKDEAQKTNDNTDSAPKENQKIEEKQARTNKSKPKPPKLGKLFCYQLISFEHSTKIYADCGFHIYRSIADDDVGPRGSPQSGAGLVSSEKWGSPQSGAGLVSREKYEIVEASKTGKDEYSFAKSTFSQKRSFTYKAYLERVVDGDTINAIVDLGFKIYHRQILRLKDVYAPEIATKEGEQAAKKLNNILQNIPFLIIKTSQIDIYGRYVADLFLGKEGLEIGEDGEFAGEYLNEMLGE
jgi:hypothetical protein